MNKNIKISLVLVALAVAVLVIVAQTGAGDDSSTATTAAERERRLVRTDSPRLTDGPDAVFVEFLDFECEACGALYPIIEALKTRYGDDVTFVVRYMPLHTSSFNAARAAEAAGAQGKYEEMYDVLFQRQVEWGHQDSPEEALFFDYADELGLDMRQFRADFDDPEVIERIEQSEADGRALGVTSTPTMFMNGERIDVRSIDDLLRAFDVATSS